jgi:hypothetical protein
VVALAEKWRPDVNTPFPLSRHPESASRAVWQGLHPGGSSAPPPPPVLGTGFALFPLFPFPSSADAPAGGRATAVDAISRLLKGMGNTSTQVADTLRAAGIRGRRDATSFQNPVVRYLNRSLTIGGRLDVVQGGAGLRLTQGGQAQETGLPAPVQEFLDAFRQGLYPDLEET